MTKTLFSIFSLLLSVVPAVAQHTAEGKVFLDANANGIYDKGETLLAGIPVSNGCDVVLTDARGSYTLKVADDSNLFPILPADYTMSGLQLVNGGFISHQRIQRRNNNFALTSKKVNNRFVLNALGDIQVSNYQEIEFVTRTLWPELLMADSAQVNLFMGDLVNNNLSLYPQVSQLIESLPQRSYTLLGNHDRDVDTVRCHQTISYCKTFGSDVYAFNEGQVHFVVLNNVYGQGASGYTGRLTANQLQFVQNDLKYVPAGSLVVLAMHIPLAQTANSADLLSLLCSHRSLVLSAHLHRVMRHFHHSQNQIVPELGVGATCGFWWVGERDWDAVPMALQQGGTPRNYFQLQFDGSQYSFSCKGVGLDAKRQLSVHITGIDTLDTHLRDLSDVPAGRALITVWGGCDSTQVRCRIDGGAWIPCTKTALLDPKVARVREMNLLKAYPTRYNRRLPMLSSESPQLWSVALTAEQQIGAHIIQVEASDSYGLHTAWQRAYCFPDKSKSDTRGGR